MAGGGVPDNPVVLLFLKVPRPGTVKTRLARRITHERALLLYRCFVADILAMLERTGFPVILCHYPADAGPEIREWLGADRPAWPQEGFDLGEKMANGFRRAFGKGFNRVLLMGTDLPDLPERFVHEAMASLDEFPAVIGPSRDGGYYLIGFRRDGFAPRIFDGISWSTPTVFGQTLELFARSEVAPHHLPKWSDIDEYEDLIDMIARNPNGKGPPDTMAALGQWGLV